MNRRLVLEKRRSVGLAVVFAFVSTATLASSCRDLGDFTLGVCGNSVLEAGEDCEPGDTNADPTKPGYCAPKGDPAECHYVCAKAACPSGEYCGVDQICRSPAATFTSAGQPVSSPARDLRIGDFDGDGRADVLLEKRDGTIDLHFASGRELGVATPLPADASEGVAVGLLNRDVDPTQGVATGSTRERLDVLVGSGAALGALLGDSGRKLTVAAVSSYSFADPAAILAAPSQAFALPTNASVSEALKPDTEVEGVSYDLIPNDFKILLKDPYGGGTPPLVGNQPDGNFGMSAAELAPAQSLRPLVDAPLDRPLRCDEIVLTAPATSSVFVVYPCGPNGKPATAGTFPTTKAVRITVPSGVTMVGPAIVADLVDIATSKAGADGHLDVAIPTQKNGVFGLYVAPGDGTLTYPGLGSDQTVHAVDYVTFGGVATTHVDIIRSEGVLALEDLNGDGALDVVTHQGIQLSTPVSPTSPNGFYSAAFPSLTPWAEAVVTDVNGDGHADVVAAPDSNRQGLEVLYGSGASYFNPSVLSTTSPIGLLTVGDFDGDLVEDIVGRAATPNPAGSCDVTDDIVVFFGRTSGGLEDGRVVGHIAGANQLISGRLPRLDRRDSITDFGVASHCGTDNYRVSVFYGTSNRLLDAPYLLTDQFGDPNDGNIAPYKPTVIAVPSGRLGEKPADSVTIAALAKYVPLGGDLPTPTDSSELFIETSDPTSLFKQQSLVSLQPITDAQAEKGALAVGSFGADDKAQIAVWLPGDPAGAARVSLVGDFHCARAGGPPNANDCPPVIPPAMPPLPSLTTVTFPTNPQAANVQKSQVVVADLDGDGRDDLAIVVVSNDGQGGLFIGRNTGDSTTPFAFQQVPNVTATSVAVLSAPKASSASPQLIFAGSYAGASSVSGIFSLTVKSGTTLAAPVVVPGTEGACGAGCDETSALGVGDVDGDGLEDIVALVGSSVHVFYRDTLVAGTVASTSKGSVK